MQAIKKILNIQHNCVMLANGTNKAAFLWLIWQANQGFENTSSHNIPRYSVTQFMWAS